MLTQDRLKELFVYDSVTGFFKNRFSRGRASIGARAGSETGHGYRRIIIDYQKYYEHRLAWLYIFGVMPEEIDHTDGNRSNNAIDNLRIATRSQNNWNSDRAVGQSGLRGAYLDKRSNQWYSKVQIGGQVKHLGCYGSALEAHIVFVVMSTFHQGEFRFTKPNTNLRI